jgi:hypothetical protein
MEPVKKRQEQTLDKEKFVLQFRVTDKVSPSIRKSYWR